jgi:hypothetical protein
MRRQLLSMVLFLVLTVIPSAAQDVTEITVSDPDAPRATIYAGYGGHGVDWEMAGDSRGFRSLVRLRGFVGQGRWVGVVETRPPAGLDPTVTRAGVMVMLSERPDYGRSMKAYGGLGVAAYIPRGVDMKAQFGTRVVLGLEAIADGWSIGPEVQIDIPRPDSSRASRSIGVPPYDDGTKLMPTTRIGIAVRKRF